MEYSEHYRRVRTFMEMSGQEVNTSPEDIPSPETRILRGKLILEEALETIHALGLIVVPAKDVHRGSPLRHAELSIENTLTDPDDAFIVEDIADGCADMIVVATGTLVCCGVPDVALLEELDRTNFMKISGGERRADGKLLKPPGWKPPRIARAIGLE